MSELRVCDHCSNPIRSSDKFCSSCGSKANFRPIGEPDSSENNVSIERHHANRTPEVQMHGEKISEIAIANCKSCFNTLCSADESCSDCGVSVSHGSNSGSISTSRSGSIGGGALDVPDTIVPPKESLEESDNWESNAGKPSLREPSVQTAQRQIQSSLDKVTPPSSCKSPSQSFRGTSVVSEVRETPTSAPVSSGGHANASVVERSTIEKTNMLEHYPNKLSWIEIVKIRGKHASTVFTVIEKLMMLDYRAPLAASTSTKTQPDSTHLETSGTTNPFNKLKIGFKKVNKTPHPEVLHPMDIMNVIYVCCDNILLQALMEKLFLCRLSIPLVFPDPRKNRTTFLLWALRGIVPEWNSGTSVDPNCSGRSEAEELFDAKSDKKQLLSLVDIPQTFLSFLRVGRLHVSKSKLLNELLSSKHHDTFFHRDCEYGMSTRIDSNGTIDASWYLPGEGGDKKSKVFSILNLRGDVADYKEQADWLLEVSDLVFIMLDLKTLERESYASCFQTDKMSKAQLVVCFVADTVEQISQFDEDLEKCQKWFVDSKARIYEVLINWNEERLLSSGEWKIEVQQVTDKYLSTHSAKKTLAEMSKIKMEKVNYTVDQKEPLSRNSFRKSPCNQIQFQVEFLSDVIKSIDPMKRKNELLPLQGKLWRKWGKIKKEQYRTKLVPEQQIEQFIAGKEKESIAIRNDQFKILQTHSFEFITAISAQFEKTQQTFSNQYFINCLQETLNVFSRDVMPALNNNYYQRLRENRHRWSKSLDEETKLTIKKENIKLSEDIDDASFGLEHIFREFGQMYEATESCLSQQAALPEKLRASVFNLPNAVAHLILNGLPFEIMDGDTSFIPMEWVKAVLEAVKNTVGDKKLFIVSVVGIQSSGKSTLLNTMFGLKFPVSAGRCTRGVYFSMIPVDKVSMGVGYDYLLVIDTEGLRAPELQDLGMVHDNELATLVVGLGDVTIVNIKGENAGDLNDVLQIVIHAMIRIKLVKPKLLKPSCLFIHQNVPAIDADDKLRIEQEKLLAKLDRITSIAAEEEKVSNIDRFQDVIAYDEHNHVFYMPDLWQGQPPMAPVNCGYSDKVKKVKDMITKNIASKSRFSNITSFANKISDLWNAILCENFVFSFKNSEEVKAFTNLDQRFTSLFSEFTMASLKLHSRCQNIVSSTEEKQELEKLEISIENEIAAELTDKFKFLQNELKTYFDSSDNCDILAQWRARYEANFHNLCTDEQNRVIRVLHVNVSCRLKQLHSSTSCRREITETALKTASILREHNMVYTDDKLIEYFDKKWPEWLQVHGGTKIEVRSTKDIFTTFHSELLSCFQTHIGLLQKELTSNPLENLDEHKFRKYRVEIHYNDLSLSSFRQVKVTNIISPQTKDRVAEARSKCEDLMTKIKAYTESCFGNDFHPGQVTEIFKHLQLFFNEIDQNKQSRGYVFTLQFRIKFTVDACKCAANKFVKSRKHFQEKNSPLAEVSKRKSDFYNLFRNNYLNVAKEITAAEWFSAEISIWMEASVSAKLGFLILDSIVTDGSSCFDTKQQFMNKILIDIGESMNFNEFMDFLRSQSKYFMGKITEYVTAIMNKTDPKLDGKTKLEFLILNELKKYSSRLKTCFEEVLATAPFTEAGEYFKYLKMKLGQQSADSPLERESLYPMNRLNIIETMRITDFNRFTALLIEKLPSLRSIVFEKFKNRCKPDGLNYDPDVLFSSLEFPEGTDPVDLIARRVLGCKERCPFCKIPCKYTCKEHAGDHNALQHCPAGVRGTHAYDTKQLVTYNCQSAVASDMLFMFDASAGTEEPIKEYRKYFPDWEIAPDRSIESSMYWKWFMNTFHDDLVSYYDRDGVKHADIPDEWKQIQWEDAKRSLMQDI